MRDFAIERESSASLGDKPFWSVTARGVAIAWATPRTRKGREPARKK
jgi:hypothetical protein